MPSSPDPGRAERLADIYARAERLRRRRRARLSTGALLGSLAVFLVGLLMGTNLEIPQQLTSIGQPDPTTSTTELRPTTTTNPSLLADPGSDDPEPGTPPGEEAGPLSPPTTQPAQRPPASTTPADEHDPAPTTTTTLSSCRNSHDPTCGPLVYEPEPVNQPMTVEVTFSPQTPKPGERITFTVRVRDDGPASPGNCINQQTYGEPSEAVSFCTAACAAEAIKYGPWDPPPPENTSFQENFRHSYAEAGTYTATFSYNVGADCSFSPYRSTGEASITVPVG